MAFIDISGELFDVTGENALNFIYPDEMMDGLLIDLGERYAFIQRQSPVFKSMLGIMVDEGIETLIIDEFDPDAPPHSWIIKSLGNILLREALDE